MSEEAEHFLAELHRTSWATATPCNALLVEHWAFAVALHHAGVSIKYRRAAEVLFRAGKVRVLFATGTLAQGLNLPARTVVFDGDSEFLNPLTYQQMAGRAGRAGLMSPGRVVFCRFTPQRVAALACSCAGIPPARGTVVLSAPSALRVLGGILPVCNLASLLTQPLAAVAAPAAAPLRQRLFLFNAALLRQRGLLGADFRLSGHQHLVSRLSYHAFSAVLFVVDLLETDVLGRALRAVPTSRQPVLLLEILACMLNRMPLRHDTVVEARSNALCGVLTPLRQVSGGVHAALSCANALTLRMLTAHLRDAAIAQHDGAVTEAQARRPALPFSGLALAAWEGAVNPPSGRPQAGLPVVRSPFSARYRLGDDFESAQELEEAMESSLQGMAGETPVLPLDVPLSNYAVLFYKGSAGCSGYGGFKTAAATSGVREDDLYGLLKDWRICLSGPRCCVCCSAAGGGAGGAPPGGQLCASV